MAISPMSRLFLYGLGRDLPAILDLLQRQEAVQVEPAAEEAAARTEMSAALAELEREIGGLERLLAFFDRYAPRRPNLIEQFAGIKTVLASGEFAVLSRDERAVAKTAEQARDIETAMAETTAALHERKSFAEQVAPWAGLSLTGAELAGTEHVRLVLLTIKTARAATLPADLADMEPRAVLRTAARDQEGERAILFWPREADLGPVLEDQAVQAVTLPEFIGTAAEALTGARGDIERLEDRLADLGREARELAAERPRVQARLDFLRSEAVKLAAADNLAATKHSFALTGWIPERKVPEVRQALADAGYVHALLTRAPEPGEDVPVQLSNPRPIVPFEALVQSFNYPQYDEIDPTPVMAPFFFLFFGFALSDAGYGVVLALFCLGLLKWLKMGPIGRKLAKLFILGGVGAVIMGLLTGSIFGDLFPMPALIQPTSNSGALILLGSALGLGVVQLLIGVVLAAVPSLKRHQWRDALFDQGVWLMFLIAVILLLGKGSVSFLQDYGTIINWFAVIAAGLVVYTGTRGRRGLLGKLLGIPAGIFRMYNGVGFFSDVLSYSRLMALGLSSGVMAMIVNLFARMAAGAGPIGVAAGVIIGVFGHTLNIALAILGAYVHSSRLQFLEFFSKFYQGGGRPFEPLRAERKYTYVVKEKEA